jgi:hypothetical protein
MKVCATQLGYYGLNRRRAGDVFEIESEDHFSKTWMEHVDGKNREPKADIAPAPKAVKPTGARDII